MLGAMERTLSKEMKEKKEILEESLDDDEEETGDGAAETEENGECQCDNIAPCPPRDVRRPVST